jgi:hypothetical protein
MKSGPEISNLVGMLLLAGNAHLGKLDLVCLRPGT